MSGALSIGAGVRKAVGLVVGGLRGEAAGQSPVHGDRSGAGAFSGECASVFLQSGIASLSVGQACSTLARWSAHRGGAAYARLLIL